MQFPPDDVEEFEPSALDHSYELISPIGKGAFSTVHSARQLSTGKQFAIKSIMKTFISKQGWINLSREIEILLNVNHPNVLRLYETIDTDTHIHMVLEYMDGGELFDQVIKRGSFNERDACKIIRQAISGIAYLHNLGVAHRDLKPENLLCSVSDERVVVADFGLAKIFGRGELLKTHCGTPVYAAPEIIRGDNFYNKAVDMWSIGVITYVLLAGYFPFYDKDPDLLGRKIMAAEYTFPEKSWSKISESAKEFIKSCLVVDPHQRLTAEEAIRHPWLLGETIGDSRYSLMSSLESFQSQRKVRGNAQTDTASDIQVI
eukprot:TRINITY_DN6420_c0_g1_i1.p1 TRINITY_DN6420_c0_g1~~TRINITY_DN6420_c0_g1_i1.p1  ORF type:complete len:317 (-),score=37.23 TRINITY_DN6420_c0_g1_i1:62-1012(-)